MAFFRFPHTPHLAWLGQDRPRDDKVLSPREAEQVLSHEVVVEEKVDGANIGFSVDEEGALQVQNRGALLSRESCHQQFKPLFRWLEPKRGALSDALLPHLILFGEWCYALHSVRYTMLPDWFLAFDVYDRIRGEFWSVARRDELANHLSLALVPRLGVGRFDLAQLEAMLQHSRLTEGPAEGLYVRSEERDHLVARAKLVRPEFAQAIDEHWLRRSLETNQLAGGAPWQ